MLLTVLIVMPLLGALPLFIARDRNAREIKVWAFLASFATFIFSLKLWEDFEATGNTFQFVETHKWIEIAGLNINYNLGIDGVSLMLVLLTTFITPIAILGAWNYIHDRQKEFYIALLLLETAMIGVFAATDLFLFYVFFEASLIPMYLIIGIWGGDEKIYATTKFIIYTAFGSLLMFIAILFVYYKTGATDFSIAGLTEKLSAARITDHGGNIVLTRRAEFWCFWAFALAFAIKVPLFPVHTWLPDAHVQAPTPGSVILASILLKMGGYGFYRIVMPFFPIATDQYSTHWVTAFHWPFTLVVPPVLISLCLIGIIYGSMMAFAQKDIKKLIAYSSVAHMGMCMLGIFSMQKAGIYGGVYQMLNHGVSTGALFLLVGMLYERTHTREIAYFSGISKIVPIYSVFFMIVTLSSIGLPLTNGFVGEFSCLLGAFNSNPWYGFWGATGVVLGAVYMLYMVKRVFFGRVVRESNKHLPDLSGREVAVLMPLIVMIFFMGVQPETFFSRIKPSVDAFVLQTTPPPAPPLQREGSRTALSAIGHGSAFEESGN